MVGWRAAGRAVLTRAWRLSGAGSGRLLVRSLSFVTGITGITGITGVTGIPGITGIGIGWIHTEIISVDVV